MKIRISDLFDDYFDEYEENMPSLPRVTGVTDAALIRRTEKKLYARRKPATALILAAAALAALLCGASVIVHFVTLRTDTLANGHGVVGVRFDEAADVTEANMVGFRAGWTPEVIGETFETTVNDQLHWYMDAIPEGCATSEETLNSAYVYYGGKVGEEYWQPDSGQGNHFYTIYAYPATSLTDAEVFLPENNAEMVKEGTLGQFHAAWLNLYDASGALSQNAILLYDEASNSVLCVSGGITLEALEKIATGLELVVTDIPAPDVDLTLQFAGAVG